MESDDEKWEDRISRKTSGNRTWKPYPAWRRMEVSVMELGQQEILSGKKSLWGHGDLSQRQFGEASSPQRCARNSAKCFTPIALFNLTFTPTLSCRCSYSPIPLLQTKILSILPKICHLRVSEAGIQPGSADSRALTGISSASLLQILIWLDPVYLPRLSIFRVLWEGSLCIPCVGRSKEFFWASEITDPVALNK